MTNECFLFLLNVNAGMQAVCKVWIEQGTVYNKMFITSANGGYVII